MARALVITHTPAESPGTLAEWLPAAGVDLEVLEPWNGDRVPDRVAADALVVMGGPQQAYDDSSAPWLRQTKQLLRTVTREGMPVLAICLGAQLLAEAMGGRVRPGEDGPELGARFVSKRDAAFDDPLFREIPLSPAVVQWHWDAIVELPAQAVLLAGSPRYPNQAFRVGPKAYGLQFHIEAPAEMVAAWAVADTEAVRAVGLEPVTVLEHVIEVLQEIEEVWRPFVVRFAELVRGETRTTLPLV
jgi:GMP synthase-like glutamine amidotransferase